MNTNRPDLETAVPEERRAEVYQASYGWFDKHGPCHGRRCGGLEGDDCQIRAECGDPVVLDGPFSEAKGNVGGFRLIEVPDLDAAIAIV